MRYHLNRSFALTLTAIVVLSGAAFSQSGTCSGMTVGQLTSLNGFVATGLARMKRGAP